MAKQFGDVKSVPEKYLLWFHRLKWTDRLSTGHTLWDELVMHYYNGAKSVDSMRLAWNGLVDKIDTERHQEVAQLLKIQSDEARWWRDACLLYFQSFSKLPLSEGYEKPEHNLAYYQDLRFYFVPGIKN